MATVKPGEGFKVNFEIEGEKQVSAELLISADKVKDFRQPLGSISGELLKTYQDNFDTRGGLVGGWKPRKDNNPWPLLEKTGAMRKNFKSDIFDDYLIIGNPTTYFPYHQSRMARKRLPRRVMMFIDEIRRVYIFKQFQEHIVNVTRGLR